MENIEDGMTRREDGSRDMERGEGEFEDESDEKKGGEGRMLMRYMGMIEKEWKIRRMKNGKRRKGDFYKLKDSYGI